MQSIKKHENEEGRLETEFANVALNRVGPGDPERVLQPSAREAGGLIS